MCRRWFVLAVKLPPLAGVYVLGVGQVCRWSAEVFPDISKLLKASIEDNIQPPAFKTRAQCPSFM